MILPNYYVAVDNSLSGVSIARDVLVQGENVGLGRVRCPAKAVAVFGGYTEGGA